jgi:hypothetical protein
MDSVGIVVDDLAAAIDSFAKLDLEREGETTVGTRSFTSTKRFARRSSSRIAACWRGPHARRSRHTSRQPLRLIIRHVF